jgi:hypothetical protein
VVDLGFFSLFEAGLISGSVMIPLGRLPRLKSPKNGQKDPCLEASSKILNPTKASGYMSIFSLGVAMLNKLNGHRGVKQASDRPHPKTQINAF